MKNPRTLRTIFQHPSTKEWHLRVHISGMTFVLAYPTPEKANEAADRFSRL
jgi:hypothetical protein